MHPLNIIHLMLPTDMFSNPKSQLTQSFVHHTLSNSVSAHIFTTVGSIRKSLAVLSPYFDSITLGEKMDYKTSISSDGQCVGFAVWWYPNYSVPFGFVVLKTPHLEAFTVSHFKFC